MHVQLLGGCSTGLQHQPGIERDPLHKWAEHDHMLNIDQQGQELQCWLRKASVQHGQCFHSYRWWSRALGTESSL
jgi:hypothetical protein